MILPFHSLKAIEESDTWWGSLVWILMLAALITIAMISSLLCGPIDNTVAGVLTVTDLSTQTSHSGVHGRPKTTAVIQHKKEKKTMIPGFPLSASMQLD